MVVVKDEDLPYEEDVLRNRYSLKSWLRYIAHKRTAKPEQRYVLYERALKELPGSYKLWHMYLLERTESNKHRKKQSTTDPAEELNRVFDRALMTMHKMPRIWIMYLDHLAPQYLISKTRRIFDRALQSLPLTQHQRIWDMYIPWVKSINVPETAVRVYRRYMQICPENAEDFVDYLLSTKRYVEAAERLATFVNDPNHTSTKGKSKHQNWLQLCDIISTHPECGRSLKVEQIIRQGLSHFVDQVGRLWTSLANYYIRQANFEKARDVFEEAMVSVSTLRDFSHVWDAYTQFEDSMIEAYMKTTHSNQNSEEDDLEFNLRMARYEYLLDRRPFLVSSVKLRQNPHNVGEWHRRVKLYKTPASIIDTYTRALRIVDPLQATGKPHTLWVNFAQYYATNGDIDNARLVFESAVKSKFRSIEELASVWCEYAEMELSKRNFSEAREVLKRATQPPPDYRKVSKYSNLPVQQRLFKSPRLWAFRADIEESLGSFESTRKVYEEMIELRVATPKLIINFAVFLEEHKYFEESFKAFEKGVHIFNYPYSLDIWLTYLRKFVERYAGSKIERTRDLFEQALENCPEEFSKVIFVTYAEVEEEFGYIRHAMSIYDRATRAVAEKDKLPIFELYLAKATEFFGVARTREIYERAIEILPEQDVKSVCLQYADLECKLGEIDRARAIYVHGSQYCDPRMHGDYWKIWRDFEVRHGNEDTFREMLRIKRSVQAQYSTSLNMMMAMIPATSTAAGGPSELGKRKRDEEEDSMEALESKVQASRQHDGTMRPAPGSQPIVFQPTLPELPPDLAAARTSHNEEEIDLGEEEEEEEEEEEPDSVQVEQIQVPESVFQHSADASSTPKKPLGALERLRARQR